jgi:predicted AlkP superfamily pyrophosphatase or phosphodiesterase
VEEFSVVKRRKSLNKKLRAGAIAGACLLAATSVSQVYAGPKGKGEGDNGKKIEHVLLLSIDGMHALDFINCSKAGTCPNLAALAKTGINYLDTSTSKPSDSFPGLMAIVAGGSPRTVGAFYDVAYDRSLQPPEVDTGNGLAHGSCSPNQVPTGTTTEYEEGVDLDQSKLNGGGPGDGQADSIDPKKLPRDPANGCKPVEPWNFVRTNTIFGIIHANGGYTAWSDKHPVYVAVSGPGATPSNVDDFFGPEINSVPVKAPDGIAQVPGCKPLPDQVATTKKDDFTTSFQNIQCYDGLKVQAILNEIDGKTHNGSPAQVPTIFGMNFQAVSIGQKLIYPHGTPPAPFSKVGGYKDSLGTPTDSLLQEIEFADRSVGAMAAELKAKGLLDTTLIIITAKHGQSPIDSSRFFEIPDTDPATLLDSFLPPSESQSGGQIGPTQDDVSLLWLKDSHDTATAVSTLETQSPATNNIAGIGEIFWGPSMGLMYNLPGLPPNGDPRTPDIIVTPNIGVVYTGSSKKLAEHGGFAHDDTNVMMLVANPSMSPWTVTSPVETYQIAPTIVAALGLDPDKLTAVQKEGTQVLPGLGLDTGHSHY